MKIESCSISCAQVEKRLTAMSLPEEIAFLRRHDSFQVGVERIVEMVENIIDLALRILRQNGGQFSSRARTREFALLTDAEVAAIERLYEETFAITSFGAGS